MRTSPDILVMTADAWGSPEAAAAFLERPHPLLGMRRPADVAAEGPDGKEAVRQVLGRLRAGVAA